MALPNPSAVEATIPVKVSARLVSLAPFSIPSRGLATVATVSSSWTSEGSTAPKTLIPRIEDTSIVSTPPDASAVDGGGLMTTDFETSTGELGMSAHKVFAVLFTAHKTTTAINPL